MKVHLVDGTYELFRHHFARPSHVTSAGQEIAATRGVLDSVLYLIAGGATHVGVATDHVIESFRNDMWPTYKSSAGMPPELLSQFGLLEDGLRAMGVTVWAMVELEADDGLASAAKVAAADDRVEQVVICTPDKDLGQCVSGTRVVQLDRRTDVVTDESGVHAKYGIGPESIPDWLALTGDSADGFPGVPGFGAKTASAVLARYTHLEHIPELALEWDVPGIRNATRVAANLAEHREHAFLFRDLATLRTEPPVIDDVEQLRWQGPTDTFDDFCASIDAERTAERAKELAKSRE
jgi:5'-3' exonuclease